MMSITVAKPPHGGTIPAIASKSHAHRALISAALANAQTLIVCGEMNEDIRATARCLQALGAKIRYDAGTFAVLPAPLPINTNQRILDCGESGSTLRFMLPVACALGAQASFLMRGRLPHRPLSPLYEELAAHGCALSPQGVSPLDVTGQLSGGVYTIAGNISSQYITGLLLALPLLQEDSRIDVTGTLESRPYVDITLQTLSDFGIEVTQRGSSFIIPGNQRYTSPGKLTVEGDWSNAACWLALGAIGPNPVTVTGLNPESPQGDKAFMGILSRFGAMIETGTGGITASGGNLRGIDADVSLYPDLTPMIAAVALKAEGQTRIQNAARLRLKECDRLRAITDTLRVFGARIAETPDGLIIDGGYPLHGASVSSEGDHRIVMMAAVASALCEGTVSIERADDVNKSYPRFFDDFRTLGGGIREEQP